MIVTEKRLRRIIRNRLRRNLTEAVTVPGYDFLEVTEDINGNPVHLINHRYIERLFRELSPDYSDEWHGTSPGSPIHGLVVDFINALESWAGEDHQGRIFARGLVPLSGNCGAYLAPEVGLDLYSRNRPGDGTPNPYPAVVLWPNLYSDTIDIFQILDFSGAGSRSPT